MVEAPAQAKSGKAAAAASKHGSGKPKLLSELDTQEEIRFTTGVGELDRVLGGGAVRGSVVLVGGAPALASPRCSCSCADSSEVRSGCSM